MRKLKKIISLITVALVMSNCRFPTGNDDNNEELLALAVLNQQGIVNFAEVIPRFVLRQGEKAYYNPGPWGQTETKAGFPNLERDTAMDVTITLTDASGYAYFTSNANNHLTIENSLAFMRLESGGIRGITERNNFNPINNLPPGIIGANTSGAGRFALTLGQPRTFCLEIHRKFKGQASPHELEGHLIAWNKTCQELTTTDRGSYVWDFKGDLIDPINLPADTSLVRRLVETAGVGYVTKDSIVTVRPFMQKFGTAGSIR